MDEELFQRRLGFVKANKFGDDKEIIARRDEILALLLDERPHDAAVQIVHAEVHAGGVKLLGELPKPGKKGGKKATARELNHVRANLKKARALSNPRAVGNPGYAGTRDTT